MWAATVVTLAHGQIMHTINADWSRKWHLSENSRNRPHVPSKGHQNKF